MMAAPMHFTLRGIPRPPRAAQRSSTPAPAKTADAKSEALLAGSPSDASPVHSRAAQIHQGWIDLLLGEVSLGEIFGDDH